MREDTPGYEFIFDMVPCNMTILDSDLRIVRANKKVNDKFGVVEGRHCYEVFKHVRKKCPDCPAQRTLADGKIHNGQDVVHNFRGEAVFLKVTTAPLDKDSKGRPQVIEMAVDITQQLKLERDLADAYTFLNTSISSAMDGVIGLNAQWDVTILNRAARDLLQIGDRRNLSGKELVAMLPAGFLDDVESRTTPCTRPDAIVRNADGDRIPTRLTGVRLEDRGRFLGLTLFLQDLRKIKHLEKEKLEAERLAAVGQTVAELAHGVKNLITGLDGGMYMVRSGIRRDRRDRVEKGWNILDSNITFISKFVKDFLSFAKGRKVVTKAADPTDIARRVVAMFESKARLSAIALSCRVEEPIAIASMDCEGIRQCLTNLIGNAIDACLMSENRESLMVTLNAFERDGIIVFEVVDNGCGMDYEVKQKVFTSFFTTKGSGGTGLGLLTTKRIVQEHGGSIDVESKPGEGTTFTIRLPRKNLPESTL